MIVALISDSHFGARLSSLLFQSYFETFYDRVFFPELRKRKITTIIHLGDLWDKRKEINIQILQRTRQNILKVIDDEGYDMHVLVGNHDTPLRDTNEINSITELCGHYSRFHIYDEPVEVIFDKLPILFVPWLNSSNMETGLNIITNSSAKVLIGHLGVAGFHMNQSEVADHGLDRNIFNKFSKVLSGHFHHQSEQGNIRYLGPPYEMDFSDLNDPKGFHLLNTETLDLTFIPNPNRMFYKVFYDDRDEAKHAELLSADVSQYENKFVKVVVPYKTKPILYDQWIDRIYKANPADVSTIENYSLEVSEDVEDQFGNPEEGEVFKDTVEVLNTYVDSIEMGIDRCRLKSLLNNLHKEALTMVGNA